MLRAHEPQKNPDRRRRFRGRRSLRPPHRHLRHAETRRQAPTVKRRHRIFRKIPYAGRFVREIQRNAEKQVRRGQLLFKKARPSISRVQFRQFLLLYL